MLRRDLNVEGRPECIGFIVCSKCIFQLNCDADHMEECDSNDQCEKFAEMTFIDFIPHFKPLEKNDLNNPW